jgi:transposase InsO family protein
MIKVKSVASIIATKVVEFINEIMYRFGVPNNIITDNGIQFTTREFKDFYSDLGIKIKYASVSHPHSIGQVERSKGMILQGLKPRIFDRLLMPANGLKNYHLYCGPFAPPRVVLWTTQHFPLFTDLRQC